MKSILIALFFVTIGYLSYKANPHLYFFERDYFKMLTSPPVSAPAVFKKLDSSCVATAQYRHDEKRTGVAPTSAQPKSGVKIKKHILPFNLDIHSASKASPTVDETGVYIGNDSGWFWKLNHDGEKLWSFYIPNSLNGIHSSVAVDDRKVYVPTYNGFIYALDKENGELVWANLVGDYIGASPLLAGGHLYISAETSHPEGLLAQLDCNTGKTLWVSEWLGGHSHSSPTYDSENKQILLGANSGRFFSFSEENGKTLWQVQLKGPIKGTASIEDGKIFFSSWDKNLYAYDLKTGKPLWETFVGGRLQTSLSLVPERSLGITNTKVGEIIGVDLNNGEIIWRLVHGDTNNMFSVLITVDPQRKNQYLAWSRCNVVELCTLDAKTGKLIQKLTLPGSFTGVPFAFGQRIYISLDKNAGLVILE